VTSLPTVLTASWFIPALDTLVFSIQVQFPARIFLLPLMRVHHSRDSPNPIGQDFSVRRQAIQFFPSGFTHPSFNRYSLKSFLHCDFVLV
jgi:hypothetical protein